MIGSTFAKVYVPGSGRRLRPSEGRGVPGPWLFGAETLVESGEWHDGFGPLNLTGTRIPLDFRMSSHEP